MTCWSRASRCEPSRRDLAQCGVAAAESCTLPLSPRAQEFGKVAKPAELPKVMVSPFLHFCKERRDAIKSRNPGT